jgi:hypothetical protein
MVLFPFYYAWTLPHTNFFFILHYPPSHFTITSVGVSRPGKGLTSRASAMHRYVLLLRGLWIHTAELLVPHYSLSSAPQDGWPVVNHIGCRRFALSWNDDMRQQDDYSQLVR